MPSTPRRFPLAYVSPYIEENWCRATDEFENIGLSTKARTHKRQRSRYPLLRDNRTSQSHVESVENDPKMG
jgi:hypothetical protein